MIFWQILQDNRFISRFISKEFTGLLWVQPGPPILSPSFSGPIRVGRAAAKQQLCSSVFRETLGTKIETNGWWVEILRALDVMIMGSQNLSTSKLDVLILQKLSRATKIGESIMTWYCEVNDPCPSTVGVNNCTPSWSLWQSPGHAPEHEQTRKGYY